MDNLVESSDGIYRIIDGKSSITAVKKKSLSLIESAEKLIKKTATKNQKKFYAALKVAAGIEGSVEKIVPYGYRAKEFFGQNIVPDILNIEKNIYFYVNDFYTEGYKIFKKVFSF